MRDWVTNVRTTHYLLGSVLGAHPYPHDGARFSRRDRRSKRAHRFWKPKARLPDLLVACVGGGSNAIGLFHAFLDDAGVKMLGVEAGGRGHVLGEHAARLAAAAGFSRRAARRAAGHVHLRSANRRRPDRHDAFRFRGLDYPAIGPEHAWLADQHRAEYTAVSDDAAVAAARTLARMEGIIPALESAHALAELIERAPKMPRDSVVILNLSGRGDKDMEILARYSVESS